MQELDSGTVIGVSTRNLKVVDFEDISLDACYKTEDSFCSSSVLIKVEEAALLDQTLKNRPTSGLCLPCQT